MTVAEDHLGEPEWPEQTFQELFRLGFKRRTVDSLEHPVFKQLRGECEPSDEGAGRSSVSRDLDGRLEFRVQEGEHPDPVCLVAQELRTGRKLRLWRDEMGISPPYDISKDSLFVAFSSNAAMSCHLALGWPLPARVLDLRVEFLQAINFTPPNKDRGGVSCTL